MPRTRSILLLALSCALSSCDRETNSDDAILKEQRRETVLKHHAEYEKELIEAEEREVELRAQKREIQRKFEETQAKRAADRAMKAGAAAKALAENQVRERKAARKAMLHKKFPALTLRNGTRYLDVEIINVGNSGITITHQNGARGIDFAQLPYSLQLASKYAPPTAK